MAENSGLMRRRDVVKGAALLAGGVGLHARDKAAVAAEQQHEPFARPEKSFPCLFTKPLGNRKFAELPELLNALGIDAVDLTCRPQGHVLPERVADDLPAAVDMLKSAGIGVPMITTAITDLGEGYAEDIIRTAGRLGVGYVKLGYYRYGDLRQIESTIAEARARIKDIAAACAQQGVHAGYHLHCGRQIGGGMWDVHQLLEGTPPRDVGCYFDLRHATAEGGDAGWEIALNLLAPRITMLALKDFIWQKDEKDRWRPHDVPLGTGMVRLDNGLQQLRKLGFAGPISLHVEYAKPNRKVDSEQDRQGLEDIRRDWQTFMATLKRAELA